MDEHDDDLEPEVSEQAEQETIVYPEEEADDPENSTETPPRDEDVDLDDDSAEL